MKERKCNEEYRPSSGKQEKLRWVSKTQQLTFLWKHKIDVLTHIMINRPVKTFLLSLVTLLSVDAFAPITFSSPQPSAMKAVVDIDGESAFDKTIQNAGSSLVVVDYSTTWCGPCKVIAPKFDELSEKYTDAVFLKVR